MSALFDKLSATKAIRALYFASSESLMLRILAQDPEVSAVIASLRGASPNDRAAFLADAMTALGVPAGTAGRHPAETLLIACAFVVHQATIEGAKNFLGAVAAGQREHFATAPRFAAVLLRDGEKDDTRLKSAFATSTQPPRVLSPDDAEALGKFRSVTNARVDRTQSSPGGILIVGS